MTYYILGAMLFVAMIAIAKWMASAKNVSWTEEEQEMDYQIQYEHFQAVAKQRQLEDEHAEEPGI